MRLAYRDKENNRFSFEFPTLAEVKLAVEAQLGASDAAKMNEQLLADYTIYELALYLYIEKKYSIDEVLADDDEGSSSGSAQAEVQSPTFTAEDPVYEEQDTEDIIDDFDFLENHAVNDLIEDVEALAPSIARQLGTILDAQANRPEIRPPSLAHTANNVEVTF
jgi:hypothetical protein